MSHPPVTPDKAKLDASSLADLKASCHDMLASTSKAKQATLLEPSPASTYGESAAAGDSIPATPQELCGNDDNASLSRSLRVVQLDDSIERISASPIAVRKTKHHAHASHLQNVASGITGASYPNPSNTGHSNLRPTTSSNSSSSSNRLQQIAASPSWRRGESFVRQSRDQGDDPFVSNGSDGHNSTSGFRPREDRVGLPLSGHTAQAVLPPNACVFVANLLQTRTDEQLEYSVARAFSIFGNVYVKIRRDAKDMPFAFCQYENVSDAQTAITSGRGLPVDGRPCRTEVAKVNRSLYLSKVIGGPVSENEARNVLARYGALEKVWFCSQTDKEMFRLPDGIWVMFAYFQDCRDAQTGFRDDPTYRLEQPRMPDDVHVRSGSRPHLSTMSPIQRYSPGGNIVSPQGTSRFATVMRSVFVGGLPLGINEQQLRAAFGSFGLINNIDIMRKPSSAYPEGINTFAFIEYRLYDEAMLAVVHGSTAIPGIHLRVEPKDSVDPLTRREVLNASGSPRNRYYNNDTHEAVALFQRGVSIGMANAGSQMHTTAPPVYPAFQYYHPYCNPYYPQYANTAPAADTDGSHSMQAQASTYPPSALGQLHYTPVVPPSYVHNASHAPRASDYHWPTASNTGQTSAAFPTQGLQ